MRASWLRVDATLPATTLRQETWGRAIAAVSTIWMLLVACWGINGFFPDGHFAATAGIGTAARNMWLFKTVYPILHNTQAPLYGSPYYMHHPLGDFWVDAVFLKIFGEHNWVLRMPAVLYSTLGVALVYRIGRAVWGPLPGALAAFAYASLPMTLGFSNFHALENPVIFGCLLSSWGYARFVQTSRGRFAAVSVVGLLWAVNHDWAPYLWAIAFVGWLFVRGFVVSSDWFGPLPLRAFGRYWGMMCGAALVSLAVTMALIIDSGKLSELLGMYGSRASGNGTPIRQVLEARHVWIAFMFPGLAVVLGKLALPVIIARVFIRRNELEILPLPILLMAVVQYLHFKQGADIHIFWPHYFAPYFALGIGALTASLTELLTWTHDRWPPRQRWLHRLTAQATAPWVAVAVLALPLLLIWKDGASMNRLAHETGGRFNSSMIQSDLDKVAALRWFLPRLRSTDKIAFHSPITVHWALDWDLRPHVLVPGQPVSSGAAVARVLFVDTRYATPADLRDAAKSGHVTAVGQYWIVDRAPTAEAPSGAIEGYSFAEREPRLWEWYFVDGTEPVRKVVPDPWVTWEWRTLLGQPAPLPAGEPRTLEQIRVAHNIAVFQKDVAGAARLRAELERRLNGRPVAHYDNGTELLGLYHHRGAERSITVYLTGAPFKGHAKFAINSRVDAAPRLSTLAFDRSELDLAHPPMIPTELWQTGHIYSVKLPYRKRPGTERFYGSFVRLDAKPAPVRVGGPAAIDLIRL